MISRNAQGDKQDAALDSLLKLSRKQQSLYQNLYKAEEQLVEATGKFNKANDL